MSLFTLYRFYDADDVLLYVGLTVNPGRRMEKHAYDKPWWSDVARIAMEQHDNLEALRAAERTAIKTEKPKHNIRMNGGGSPRRQTAPQVSAEPPPEGLIGRWFHSYIPIPEGKDTTHNTLDGRGNMREWQGQIIDRDEDIYIAQLYSWWDGQPTNEVVIEVADMRHWKFYASNQDMLCANGCEEDFGNGRSGGRSGACGRPCTHVIRNYFGGATIYRCWECIKFYSGKVEEL